MVELIRDEIDMVHRSWEVALESAMDDLRLQSDAAVDQAANEGAQRAIAPVPSMIRTEVTERSLEVFRELTQMTQTCARVMESLQIERYRHEALISTCRELLSEIRRSGATSELSPGPRVFGGTVTSPTRASLRENGSFRNGMSIREEPLVDAGRGESVDLAALEHDGEEVFVRSRFDEHWARGFEISDVADRDGERRYRLRRRSDGVVLPEWFSDTDLRVEHHRLHGHE